MYLPRLGTLKNNEEVKMALREWLRMQERDVCHDGRYKLTAR